MHRCLRPGQTFGRCRSGPGWRDGGLAFLKSPQLCRSLAPRPGLEGCCCGARENSRLSRLPFYVLFCYLFSLHY